MRERVSEKLWINIRKAAPIAVALAFTLGFSLGNGHSASQPSVPEKILRTLPTPGTASLVRPWGTLYAKRPENQEQGWTPFSAPQGRRVVPPQYQEWQSMPPQEKDNLRHRFEEYRKLPPQDQELYRQRYRQWQQIPPEDRRRIESDIQRWNELSPEQREAIRRLFNR